MTAGKLTLRFHPGQSRAWRSTARFILVLAGTRSGKTAFSPWWLHREIKNRGPGDYLLCAPTYKLLDKAAVPYLSDALGVKLQIGKLIGGSQGRFEVSKAGEWQLWGASQDRPTRVIFGHADEPDSLEAAQYKGAVCDEAGQKKFKMESWEAIQRRLAIDRGRALFPTTPYVLGWLKSEVFDRARRRFKAIARGMPVSPADADYDCVSFESIENPAFPIEEWERAKATLPRWKFNLFFRGQFERPAGAVYDCWHGWIGPNELGEMGHIVEPFTPDPKWPRYHGHDFGAPNYACVKVAAELGPDGKRTGKRFVYDEYSPSESRTVKEHIAAIQKGEPGLPAAAVGGAKSEGNWRQQAAADHYPINPPDQPDVEVGIGRVYEAIKAGKLCVTANCVKLIEDLNNYSREIDDAGNVLNDIEDKETFHRADALRYIVSWLDRTGIDFFFKVIV